MRNSYWRDRARCRGMNDQPGAYLTDLFDLAAHQERHGRSIHTTDKYVPCPDCSVVTALCTGCPVRLNCLADAMPRTGHKGPHQDLIFGGNVFRWPGKRDTNGRRGQYRAPHCAVCGNPLLNGKGRTCSLQCQNRLRRRRAVL